MEEETILTSIRLQFPHAVCAKINDKILHLDILDKDLNRSWLEFFRRHQLDVKFPQLFVNDGSNYKLQDCRPYSKRMVWKLTSEVRQFAKSFIYIPHKVGYRGKIVKMEPSREDSTEGSHSSSESDSDRDEDEESNVETETECEGVGEENQDSVEGNENLEENIDKHLNKFISISKEKANNIRNEMTRIQGISGFSAVVSID